MHLALRQLAKSPGFAFVAIATLALGIGACTAMFSIVRAVLLKPLPFHEPERLVWIENTLSTSLSGRASRADVVTGWRDASQTLEAVGAYDAFSDQGRSVMTGRGEPAQLRRIGISEHFLATLGVLPLHGRTFTAEECATNGPRSAMLSHAAWQRSFGGDPAVVGQAFTLNNQPTTIVGVLPASFDFDAIFSPGSEVDVLTPYPLTPETARRGNNALTVARLRPGATLEQAQTELSVISERLRESVTNAGTFGARVTPLSDAVRGRFRTAFSLLAGAVACVLTIACVNLSSLLLTRLNVRRQEFAVRIALGAPRWHFVRQALAESWLLAIAGATVGLPLAMWAVDGLARLQTFGVPLLQDARVDPVALVVTVALTTLAATACSVLPALHLFNRHRASSVEAATHQRSAGRSATVTRNALVVIEVALACVLLVVAGLLFRSFNSVLQVRLGFEPQQAMAWRFNRAIGDNAAAARYFDAALERVAAIPGVQSVGLSDALPLRRGRSWTVGAKGVAYGPDNPAPQVFPRFVDHGYLQAMQIPLVAGRYFDQRDIAGAEHAVLVNEAYARQMWPDRDAVGQYINHFMDKKVIGVVANVRHGAIEEEAGNEIYFNYHQWGDWSRVEMVVRSTLPPAALVREVRGALAAFDPSLATSEFFSLDDLVDNAVAPRRLITRLLGFFSTLALTLSALGLYGVMAYSVTQRTQEIGIRMAIGAQRGDVLRLVLHGGFKLVALGVLTGLAGSLGLVRLLQNQLYGVSAYDPLVFIGIAGLLLLVAAVACVLPALRATRIDPLVALRAE